MCIQEAKPPIPSQQWQAQINDWMYERANERMNVLAMCYIIHWMVLYALLSHNCLHVRDKKCCVRFTATHTSTPVLFTDSFRNRQKLLSACASLPFPAYPFECGQMCTRYRGPVSLAGLVCRTRILKTLAFKDGKPKNLHINEMYKHRLFEKWLSEHFAQTPNATRELIIFVSDVFFVTV